MTAALLQEYRFDRATDRKMTRGFSPPVFGWVLAMCNDHHSELREAARGNRQLSSQLIPARRCSEFGAIAAIRRSLHESFIIRKLSPAPGALRNNPPSCAA